MQDLEFQNRDSDTHMEIDKEDLMNPNETSGWEKDLALEEIYQTSEALEHETELEQ